VNVPDFYEFIVKMLHEHHLPAFLSGFALGASSAYLVIRLVARRMSLGLVRELRDRIDQLQSENRALGARADGLQDQLEAQERECGHLRDKVQMHLGQVEAHREQVLETTSVCERLTGELFDVQDKLKKERKARRALQKVAQGYSDQLDDITNSDGKIWLKSTGAPAVPFLPLGVRRASIVAVANLKGGVGKTTIAANLGAALAVEGLRVLLIDLDHQSSLSNLCLSAAERVEIRRSHRYIDDLFAEGGDLSAMNRCVTRLQTSTGAGQLYLAPTHEDFGDVENRLMTRWNAGLIADDVRLRLRAALHSPGLRDSYDVVLIDCPPRLTTGCINALAASDYVLIPVLLESTSADAVPRLLEWLKRFRSTAFIELNVLGVVGNRAFPRKQLIARQRVVWTDLQDRCRDAWGDPVTLFDEVIREHPNVNGPFAALDPKHRDRYHRLVSLIRQEIPHARLQASAVHSVASASPGSRGD
jgi:cellulose biosynthesis protein BcsQ